MEKKTNSNYTDFILKLSIIKFFYLKQQLSCNEIAFIIDSHEEIVQLYCKRLIN